MNAEKKKVTMETLNESQAKMIHKIQGYAKKAKGNVMDQMILCQYMQQHASFVEELPSPSAKKRSYVKKNIEKELHK